MTLYRRSNKHSSLLDNKLWRFSVEFYQKPGNETSLLYLQNSYYLNINILLTCLWYAYIGYGVISKSIFLDLLEAIKPWQEKITLPIRQIRHSLPQIKDEILTIELFTEKIQQSLIYEKLTEPNKVYRSLQKTKDAINNFANYYAITKVNLDENGYEYTRHLLAAAFDDFNEEDFPQMRMDLGV